MNYMNLIHLIGKVNSGLLEMVKLELDRLGIYDLNNVQAMMLFNISDAEMSIGELTLRGCYLGSNVSYNIKKMVDTDYIVYNRSVHDRRSVRVKVSPKGLAIVTKLNDMFDRHRNAMDTGTVNIKANELADAVKLLTRLDRMWGREHASGMPNPAHVMPINRAGAAKTEPDAPIGKAVPPEDGRDILRRRYVP